MSIESDNVEFSCAAWKRLQFTTSYAPTKRSIHLFVGPSADAAAAWKTMRQLLRSYLICEEVHIIEHIDAAYGIIRQRAKALEDQMAYDDGSGAANGKEIAVFLGCGANADLPRELDWSVLSEVHVIDNYRPVHLNLMRHAIAAKQFLAAVSGGDFSAPKPERCIFLWDHASAEREVDAFFHLMERMQPAAAARGAGAAGRRRRRGADGGEAAADDGGGKAAGKKKQQKESARRRAVQSRDHTLGMGEADGGDKKQDKEDGSDGGEDTNHSADDAAAGTAAAAADSGKRRDKKQRKDDDDGDDFDSDDLEDTSEDDDDESNASFVVDDDEALQEERQQQKRDKRRRKKKDAAAGGGANDQSSDSASSSSGASSSSDDDDDGEQGGGERPDGASTDPSPAKRSKKKQRRAADADGGEDSLDGDDNDDASTSSEDDDDDEEEEEDNASHFATTTARSDADWSAMGTGASSSIRRRARRAGGGGDDDDEGEDETDIFDDYDYMYGGAGDRHSLVALWRTPEGVGAERELHYYSRIFCGRSLAVVFHELAVRLEQADPEYVWHAAIGIAELRMRGVIAPANYESEMRRLENAVVQFDSAIKRSTAGRQLQVNTLNVAGNAAGSLLLQPSNIGASGKLTQIRRTNHVRLFMLDHCTLWQALWYDRHVSAALGLLQPGLHSNSSGAEQLRTLLSDVGMPVSDAREYLWRDLPRETREYVLPRLLQQLRRQFRVAEMGSGSGSSGAADGSDEMWIPSLMKKVGYDDPVTAFDACHLFYGCLGAQGSAHYGGGANDDDNGGATDQTADDLAGNNSAAARLRRLREDDYRRCFESGVAVLSAPPESELFKRARDETVSLQGKVTDAVETVLSGNSGAAAASLTLMTNVQKVTVPLEHRIAAIEHFCVPARLRALAIFLSAYQHNYGGGWQHNQRRHMLNGRVVNRQLPIVIGVADSAAAGGITAAHMDSENVVGTVAIVIAPPAVIGSGGGEGSTAAALSSSKQRHLTATNAFATPNSVLAHFRQVQAQLGVDSGFCGAYRDLCIGSVVGTDNVREIGDLLHLDVHMAGQGNFPAVVAAAAAPTVR